MIFSFVFFECKVTAIYIMPNKGKLTESWQYGNGFTFFC